MKVTVIGASGTYGAPGEPCSGFLLESGGTFLMLDCGPGTVGEVQRHLPLTSLDALFVSHSHPDHWMALPTLVNALRYVLDGQGLDLYTTAETIRLLEAVGHRTPDPVVVSHAIDESSVVEVGPFTVSCSRTDHPPETLAFCVSDGTSSLAYSADTGPRWSPSAFGEPVDLLLCEATFRDGDAQEGPAVHLTARQAGEIARSAGARRLAITHLLPGADPEGACLEASAAFGAPVEIARRGVVFDL
jgi:ribonuclease BN (tRNA processing enzyme)